MRKLIAALLLLGALTFCLNSFAQDPSGAKTLAENPQAPVDYVWVLMCGFLVFFMQAGFAMVETGFCRAKNATSLMAKNAIDFVIASLAFFAFGFALMMGTDYKGIVGVSGWFLHGENYDVGKYLMLFWQLVFAGTAATIVSGAVAERLKFKAYIFIQYSGNRINLPSLRTLGLGRRLAF
jgi:Amt family ammonium transporter